MGAYSFSIPTELLDYTKQLLKCSMFVETGTFHGASSIIASKIFHRVITCEYSTEIRNIALNHFQGIRNIESHQGDSPDFLAKQHPKLSQESVCYWLDAHWCASHIDVGSPGQTRILEELSAINKLNDRSIIFIDDARYYIAPPKKPNVWQEWPDITSVINALKKVGPDHFIMIYNDVICCVPNHIQKEFVEKTAATIIDPSESLNTILILTKKLCQKYGRSPLKFVRRLFARAA